MIKRIKYFALLCLFIFITPKSVVYGAEVELINVHPSDSSLFVQGMELDESNRLIVSSGLYKESSIGYLNLETGNYEIVEELKDEYFAEGITVTPDFIWQLTWREGVAIKREKTNLEVIDQTNYNGEGWGLAYDPDSDVLWMSDGSEYLQVRAPDTFELIRKTEVTYEGSPVIKINELEYANGLIFANIWYSNQIIAIDPQTGEVRDIYDINNILEETLSEEDRVEIDSLNGIAHIEGNRFYITGKKYPVVYEVELKRK